MIQGINEQIFSLYAKLYHQLYQLDTQNHYQTQLIYQISFRFFYNY